VHALRKHYLYGGIAIFLILFEIRLSPPVVIC
jgi:hypothetical protein